MENEEAAGGKERSEENQEKAAEMSSKEKRKAMKKMKRKQMRKEIAEKERKELEAKLNDPAEQERLRAIEEEEARLREEELKKFEESERAWREAMEMKRKKEEEEEAKREEEEKRWKDLEESRKLEASRNDECGEDEDGEYEYIEEGPPEIIFQGNEIILRKNKVKVPKKSRVQVEGNEISDRPTSNPLPPRTEDFTNYQNVRSAQQILENVAQEVPNFGTEQDKSHCPFHLKTGACRFGPRCSRVHFYPDKSCTLLMKNMYNGPGIAWEQDEGLEYTEEEAERCYEEFYEDVHTEFLKYGELVNFKVKCDFVNISRWKVAICGEYMKSRLKTCSRGSACNFIHCFRNPGGDYEWADHDKPPPRFWIHKMAALFGYSDEYLKSMEREYSRTYNDSRADLPTDSYRQHSRRSKSRDHDHENVGSKLSYRNHKNHGEHSHGGKLNTHEKYHNDGRESPSNSTRDCSLERDKDSRYVKDTSRHETKWSKHSPRYQMTRKRIHDDSSDGDDDDREDISYKQRNSKRYSRNCSDSEVQEQVDDVNDSRTRVSCSNKNSRRYNTEKSAANQEKSCERSRNRSSSRNSYVEFSEKDSTENKHKRSNLQDQENETRHGEYQLDKDRNGDRYRSQDRDFGRSRSQDRDSGRSRSQDRDSGRSRRSSRNGVSVEELRELNGTETKGNVSGGSSEESSDRETHKERQRRRRSKRRRRSRHSPEEMVKFCEDEEGEIERWRPV